MTIDHKLKESFKPVALKDTDLFKPLQLTKTINLQHRVVLPPLTRFRNTIENVPTELSTEYYKQRASSKQGGLLITEATFISPQAGGYVKAPGIYSQAQIEGWRSVFKAVHEVNSFIFVQLWALGRTAKPDVLARTGQKFVAPSEIYTTEEVKKTALQNDNPIHALTIEEIKQYVKEYAQAAKNAVEAGADGVEIHSANSYLLNQFLDPASNKRTDEYGGSIENRSKFTLEVVDAIVEAIGAEKTAIRFSPYGVVSGMSGDQPGTLAIYAYLFGELEKRALEGKRLAFIHLVEPRVTKPTSSADDGFRDDVSNDFIYSIWKGNVVKAGNYGFTPEDVKKEVKNPKTLIAYGRLFIANPDLPLRLAEGFPLTDYERDQFYTEGAKGYTDYPTYAQITEQQQ
ncbi:hypothetical protein WICMUC_002078 [Wickerhamomyces mucosus]|uniref:NADH:flavin oxidoreductase/NADH oxidase N-terminal domain-containing protein n=1 Tax=Wickerhamomyces mucosus TaxID=1378264 RepID=A0A9P8PQX8_9ASCO|nr:hypothetical protein WICMUC_002078 [Wickerhamomyces mucosus]